MYLGIQKHYIYCKLHQSFHAYSTESNAAKKITAGTKFQENLYDYIYLYAENISIANYNTNCMI